MYQRHHDRTNVLFLRRKNSELTGGARLINDFLKLLRRSTLMRTAEGMHRKTTGNNVYTVYHSIFKGLMPDSRLIRKYNGTTYYRQEKNGKEMLLATNPTKRVLQIKGPDIWRKTLLALRIPVVPKYTLALMPILDSQHIYHLNHAFQISFESSHVNSCNLLKHYSGTLEFVSSTCSSVVQFSAHRFSFLPP